MEYKTSYNSILGQLIIKSDGESITGLCFSNARVDDDELDLFQKVKDWLDAYFKGENLEIDFPIKLNGTSFQLKVWNEVSKIQYGSTVSYKQLAQSLNSKAYRAIGQAVKRNPILIIVPCHRVIKNNGEIGGFIAGSRIKKELLDLEAKNLQSCKE